MELLLRVSVLMQQCLCAIIHTEVNHNKLLSIYATLLIELASVHV